MIFSIGYGRDENGKFTLQLGPITKKGGERRQARTRRHGNFAFFPSERQPLARRDQTG